MNQPTVADCLRYLDRSGWSILIDSRWKDVVVKELKENVPNATDETIEETLKIVIV